MSRVKKVKKKDKPIKWVNIRDMARLRCALRAASEVRILQKTGVVCKGRIKELHVVTSVSQSRADGIVSFYQDGYWRLTTFGEDVGTRRRGTPIEVVYTEPIELMLKLIPIYSRGREREVAITVMFKLLHHTVNQRVRERVRRVKADNRAMKKERIKENMRLRKVEMHKWRWKGQAVTPCHDKAYQQGTITTVNYFILP